MKHTLVFKTPDVMDSVDDWYERDENDEVLENAFNDDVDALKRLAKKYIQYGEYVRIEFNTDEETVRVLKI